MRRKRRGAVGKGLPRILARQLLLGESASARRKTAAIALVGFAAAAWRLKENRTGIAPTQRKPRPQAGVLVRGQDERARRPAVAIPPSLLPGPPPEAAPSTPRWRERLERRGPDLVFAGLCLLIGLVRFHTLTRGGAAPGVDSGNWLALGRSLVGESQRSATIVYPPVVPLLVLGVVNLLGLVHGIAILTVVASLAAAAAVHVVLRAAGLRWEPPVLGGLLAAGSATGEAAAWGGIPQLLSLGLTVLFVWALDRYLRTSRVRYAAGAGLLLAMVMATSHLVAFAAALSAATLVAVHLFVLRRRWPRPRWRVLFGGGVLIAVPCLPLLPLYRTLATGLEREPAEDAHLVLLDLHNIVGSADFLFRDFAVFWRLAVTAALIMPVLLWRRRRTVPWALATSLLSGTLVASLLTRQARYLYVLPVATVLAIAVWAAEIRDFGGWLRASRLVPGLLSVALAGQLWLGVNFFGHQRDYYGVVDRQTVTALRWLRTSTSPSSTLAVTTGKNDQLLGWWVESLTERRTLFASRLVWLNFEDERMRAKRANALFRLPFPSEATLSRARRAGVDYLVAAKAWPPYDSARVSRLEARQPGTVVFENPAVVILRVPGAGPAPP